MLRSGVVLPDGLIQPVSVTFVPPKIKKEEKRRKEGRQLTEEEDFYSQMTKMKAGEDKSKRKEKKSGGKWDVDIVIDEGRNRVFRKMVSKVKLGHLDSLKRLRFGPVSLQSLGFFSFLFFFLKKESFIIIIIIRIIIFSIYLFFFFFKAFRRKLGNKSPRSCRRDVGNSWWS